MWVSCLQEWTVALDIVRIIVELREEESCDILTRIVQRLTYYMYMTCTVMKPYKPYT